MSNSNIQLTVPQYYNKFIDKHVHLEETPKVCCPFHKEDTPSFSYNPSTGRWRCFGACKTGGDVIDLHRMNYKLHSRLEAEKSLCTLLGVPVRRITSIESLTSAVIVDEEAVELDRIYNLCLLHANCPERWVQMDYVMSIYPVDVLRLKDLLKDWKVKYD